MKILTVKEIQEIYGFNRDEAYALLQSPGCPVLMRKHNQKYRVIQEEFEKWLRSMKNAI